MQAHAKAIRFLEPLGILVHHYIVQAQKILASHTIHASFSRETLHKQTHPSRQKVCAATQKFRISHPARSVSRTAHAWGALHKVRPHTESGYR